MKLRLIRVKFSCGHHALVLTSGNSRATARVGLCPSCYKQAQDSIESLAVAIGEGIAVALNGR